MPDWNVAILLALYHIRTPWGVDAAEVTSLLGSALVVVPVLIAALYILKRGRPWAHAYGLLVAVGGSAACAEFLKNLLQFDRPDSVLWAIHTFDYGFPSIHTTATTALYGFLLWCVWEKGTPYRISVTILCAILMFAVPFSRMYLGVHWPIDIIGGYLVGGIFVYLGVRSTRHLEQYEHWLPKAV